MGIEKLNKGRKIILLAAILLFFQAVGFGQQITGNFSALPVQTLRLQGFDGFNLYPIDSTQTDALGAFRLHFSAQDYGMALLQATESKPLIVLLADESIVITGEAPGILETLTISQGKQNQALERYVSEQVRREQALSAWNYLEKIYTQDTFFSVHRSPIQAIENEKQRIQKEETRFLEDLPSDSYVRWFLPIRKLISNLPVVAQHHPEDIPATREALRSINYADARLYKSGLFKESLENHVLFIENTSFSLDAVYENLNTSIDIIVEQLQGDEAKFNKVTDYLFQLLESRSLFISSEYLALKVLNEVSCSLDSDLSKQLETYRAMKKGNIAPDITFCESSFMPGYKTEDSPSKLSDLNSPYTLVVFGSSWCPQCAKDVPSMAALYPKWKAQGLELVFVSLDDERSAFQQFAKDFPFISTCDFKKWDSPIAQDYYVFATPTMFLLDDKREIVLRPTSVKQMEAWVAWFLVQGNRLPSKHD